MTGERFNLELLNTFVVFAEHLNLTHAARVLHLSQPAVYLHVKRLTESLGVPLYRRVGRRLELTAAGRQVASFGVQTQQRTAEFVGQLRSGVSHHPVTLAAGEGAYLYLLGDAIKAFLGPSRPPLRLLTRDRAGTLEAVESGQAELGVAALDTPPDGLLREALTTVDQMLVVPRRHRLAKKRVVSLDDLAGESLIVPPPDRPHRVALSRALQGRRVEWRVAVETSGWELMLHFAVLGLGLAVVNGFCRLPRSLVGRPLRELPDTVYYVVYQKNALEQPGARALHRVLLEHASAWKKARGA